MATKSKTTSTSPKSKPSSKAAKKTVKPKTSSATGTKTSPEEKVAADVLKLLRQATETLDKNLKAGATNTAKARQQAAKKAYSLLGDAHKFLGKSLDDSVSTLKKAINKIS